MSSQINQLKMKVKNFNEEFKNQITQKEKQADQVIQIKTQEIEKNKICLCHTIQIKWGK